MAKKHEMKSCIFDNYFAKGKICFREYDCDYCPVKEEVKKIAQAVAQSNKPLDLAPKS